MKNIQHEYFIWEENKNTQLQNNNCKQDENDNCFTTIETKTDLTQNDWKNITNPKERRKAWMKAYYKINKDEIKTRQKTWYEGNKDVVKNKQKNYLLLNKDKIKVKKKAYHQDNKDKLKIAKKNYHNNRLKTDIQYKLSCNLRIRLHHAINRNQKIGSAIKDLGCTIEQLKQYLESKFQAGMTWDNWTLDGWHIDHIKPLASFDLTDRKQLLEACHYTNLQPLWAKDNLTKNDKII